MTESQPNQICILPTFLPLKDEDIPHISQGFNAEGLKVFKSSMSVPALEGIGETLDTQKVEWNIRNFSTKLKAQMGRPLVSAPFTLGEFEEVRLMVTPCMQEGSTGPRSRKEKEQFTKNVTEGPLRASLTLKIPNAPCCKVRYCLSVGKEKTGPYECDFSNTAIDNRGSFGINWLSELDKDLSITVSVEMLPPAEVHHRAPPGLPSPTEAVTQDQEPAPLPGIYPSAPPGLPPPPEAIGIRRGANIDELLRVGDYNCSAS